MAPGTVSRVKARCRGLRASARRWVRSAGSSRRAWARASTVATDGRTARPCSSRTYQSTPIPASSATSSRRRPGVRRRRPPGRPSSAGVRRSRRERRKSPSSTCDIWGVAISPRIVLGLLARPGARLSRTMKAAVLNEFGSPLEVTTLPDLVLGTGEIIVDVVAAHVLSYTGEVLRGERNYALELPLAPGTAAVGQVRATGPDSTRLRPGDWVLCDITVRSRDSLQAPDIVLQGWSARGPGGRQLMRHYRHGAFASQMMIPTENAIPLGPMDESDAGRWCALDLLLVPYGGLTAVGLHAGETVLVSGATGNYGSAGVAVALAMGAARVVAPGRNQAAVHDLSRRFGDRVRTVRLTGESAEDQQRMRS